MASQQIPVNPMYQQQQQQQPQQPQQQQQQQSTDSTHNSDTMLADPITKCKDLLPQLKQSLYVIF